MRKINIFCYEKKILRVRIEKIFEQKKELILQLMLNELLIETNFY